LASYEQLAELSGISSRTLREIHTHKRTVIQWATADAVCAALDTPIGAVYGQEEP
jgi:DNA-binding Xre family transcriptional regulator